ncbi:MAG TPA: putative quinol monooxygenase [Microthrixaceae bacterium]|nr:putative quinol monooxygenase [Microthrixaceae bacterium]
MLIVSGVITFDPAKQADLVALVEPLVTATLAEAGNITYGFWLDPLDAGRTRVYEEWESTDAMNEHMGTAHMAAFMEGMGGIGVTGVEIIQHEVTNSSKLM